MITASILDRVSPQKGNILLFFISIIIIGVLVIKNIKDRSFSMSIKLSICMPTFNFGKFIGETLDSIIPQLTDQIEIVILDGGSTDNTHEIVQAYQKTCPQIQYFRQTARGGIDLDMHLSVENAQGEYCWLFSSDDIMRPGAIHKILTEIAEGIDVYLCDFTICEYDCKTPIFEHYILKNRTSAIFNLSDSLIRAKYFELAIETTAFFGFMSSLIIRRARWIETPAGEQFFGTCWSHAARILHMIPQGLQVKYLPLSLLLKRSYNDSFMDKGMVHRFSIAIDGFQKIVHSIFGEQSIEAFHITRVLKAEFPLRFFLVTKLSLRNKLEKKRLLGLFNKLYSDMRSKVLLMNLLAVIPHPLIAFLRILYRTTLPLRQYLHNRSATAVSSD
jgi:abequosyltransferase